MSCRVRITSLTSHLILLLLLSMIHAAKTLKCDPSAKYRTLDGTCNNLNNLSLGSTGSTLLIPDSLMPANITASLPSARLVSNALMATWWSQRSEKLTDLFTYFAQFVDHDLIRFPKPSSLAEHFPILVSKRDGHFRGPTLPFKRLETVNTPRGLSPKNELSAYIDASLVYGTTEKRLQDIKNGTDGCRLNVGEDNMLPLLSGSVDGKFLAGDSRVNENLLLASLHTLWMREHNTLCAELRAEFPEWSNEHTFKEVRKILGAEIQKVTYEEWLPSILGSHLIPKYTGYNKSVDPRPSLFFAGSSFRVGHVLVNDAVVVRNQSGDEIRLGIEQTLFSTKHLLKWGLDSVLRGAISNRAKKINLHIVHALRNLLITQEGGRFLDLASINIQRARDLQVPLYNEARSLFGLTEIKTFNEITSDKSIAKKLQEVYGKVGRMDSWIGGLAEEGKDRSVMGELFSASWVDEFRRIRDGDRFFYKTPGLFDHKTIQKSEILRRVLDHSDRTVMKNIILRNTRLKSDEVPDNPFIPYEK